MGGWRDRAACRDADTNLFFPGWGQADSAATRLALAYCEVCPVREECLEAGLRERYGIWGGLTVRQRVRRRRRTGAKGGFPTGTILVASGERCGSEAGYQMHRRRGTAACEWCRRAHALYQREHDRVRAERRAMVADRIPN